MKEVLIPIIIAVISSNAIFGFIQFLINRKDSIKAGISEIKQKLNYIDQGMIRMQLLVLISNYPDRLEEIMKLAYKYFISFKGNYYLTTLFKKYLDDNNIAYPNWWSDVKQ